jgi:hypothetical protein
MCPFFSKGKASEHNDLSAELLRSKMDPASTSQPKEDSIEFQIKGRMFT